MYILGICENAEILKVFRLVNIVIMLIKIAVPILLIVSVMIDYMKAVMNHDQLSMTNKLFVNKIMAAVLVFMIPTFVNIIINVIDPRGISYAGCLNSANSETISQAYVVTANKLVDTARESLLQGDYLIAQSAVRNVDDENLKAALTQELEEIKININISSDIDALNSNYSEEEYDNLQERINNITDMEIKERLDNKLNNVNKSSYQSNYSEYPINPDASLYSGLSFLIDESLDSFLSKNGYSVEAFNNKIKNSVVNAGVGTRNGTVAAAMTLIGTFAEMGKKLNYQWGGKYQSLGVNPNWGTTADMDWLCGPNSYGAHYDSNVCFTNYKWKSFDCSGFVTWAVINGMQNSKITQSEAADQYGSGTVSELNSNYAVCKPGEALEKPGSHVVLVVGTDDANKRYIVAESTGSRIAQKTGGVKLSYYSYGKDGYHCLHLENVYGN